jgi:hypothetical protein
MVITLVSCFVASILISLKLILDSDRYTENPSAVPVAENLVDPAVPGTLISQCDDEVKLTMVGEKVIAMTNVD